MQFADNALYALLSPDIYDRTLNPLHRNVLPHYSAVALLKNGRAL